MDEPGMIVIEHADWCGYGGHLECCPGRDPDFWCDCGAHAQQLRLQASNEERLQRAFLAGFMMCWSGEHLEDNVGPEDEDRIWSWIEGEYASWRDRQ